MYICTARARAASTRYSVTHRLTTMIKWLSQSPQLRPRDLLRQHHFTVAMSESGGTSRVRSIANSVPVCLSVGLSVSLPTCPNLTKFSVHITRGRGSILL